MFRVTQINFIITQWECKIETRIAIDWKVKIIYKKVRERKKFISVRLSISNWMLHNEYKKKNWKKISIDIMKGEHE